MTEVYEWVASLRTAQVIEWEQEILAQQLEIDILTGTAEHSRLEKYLRSLVSPNNVAKGQGIDQVTGILKRYRLIPERNRVNENPHNLRNSVLFNRYLKKLLEKHPDVKTVLAYTEFVDEAHLKQVYHSTMLELGQKL